MVKRIVLIALLLGGCMQSPPEVIERSCVMVELQEKPAIPEVIWIAENCPYYLCIDEQNYNALNEREALIRAYANYVIEVYNGARERCR